MLAQETRRLLNEEAPRPFQFSNVVGWKGFVSPERVDLDLFGRAGYSIVDGKNARVIAGVAAIAGLTADVDRHHGISLERPRQVIVYLSLASTIAVVENECRQRAGAATRQEVSANARSPPTVVRDAVNVEIGNRILELLDLLPKWRALRFAKCFAPERGEVF